jgi:hypothetical protein
LARAADEYMRANAVMAHYGMGITQRSGALHVDDLHGYRLGAGH